MGLVGFESWEPYKESLDSIPIDNYFPYQGDLIQLIKPPNDIYLCISGCCDIYRQDKKLDYLQLLKAYPLPIFMKQCFLDKQDIKQNVNDGFSTPIKSDFDINEFDEFLAGKNKGKELLMKICRNDYSPRYIFLPHQTAIYNVDLVIDLQALTSIKLSSTTEDLCINDRLPTDSILKCTIARLNYRFRDIILQSYAFYTSRIALPEKHVPKPTSDGKGFYSQISERIKDYIQKT